MEEEMEELYVEGLPGSRVMHPFTEVRFAATYPR
jgi:hypothetical protein